METVFLTLIQQLNSSVFILLGLVFLVGMSLLKLGGWAERFKHQDKRLCDVEEIHDSVVELRTKVDLIYQHVNRNKPIQSMSPLTFTQIGHEIVKNINAEKIFARYSDRLTKEVDAKNPQNAYDIQQESFNVVKGKLVAMLDESELTTMKNEAYTRGTILEDIVIVFAILLRNHILQLKNIPISDVDKHQKPNP